MLLVCFLPIRRFDAFWANGDSFDVLIVASKDVIEHVIQFHEFILTCTHDFVKCSMPPHIIYGEVGFLYSGKICKECGGEEGREGKEEVELIGRALL